MGQRPIDLRNDYVYALQLLSDHLAKNRTVRALITAIDHPEHLNFIPSQWSKYVLAGFKPNDMYTITASGGLPDLVGT